MESSSWRTRWLHNSSALNSDVVYQLRRRTVRLVRKFNPTSQRSEPYPEEALTDRESELFGGMTDGYSNREIAEALYISEGTVKNQVSNT
jgi:DNA-binding NarL/FixJ family response regulator